VKLVRRGCVRVRVRLRVCACVVKKYYSIYILFYIILYYFILFYIILYYFIRLIYNKKFSKMVRRSKRCVGSRRTRRNSRRHSRHSTRSRRVRRVHSRHTRGRRIRDVKIGGGGGRLSNVDPERLLKVFTGQRELKTSSGTSSSRASTSRASTSIDSAKTPVVRREIHRNYALYS
jgi:hypothetical protein